MSHRWLERLTIAVASVVVAVVAIILLSGYFTSHDSASVSNPTDVGFKYADQGDELLAPSSRRPHYDSDPPTSGPHVPAQVTADQRRLSNDQILTALSAGNVVILYGGGSPPRQLVQLAGQLADPFSPALVRSGQAVILARRPGTDGIIALAWTRMLRQNPIYPTTLGQFVRSWLGRGAGAAPGSG